MCRTGENRKKTCALPWSGERVMSSYTDAAVAMAAAPASPSGAPHISSIDRIIRPF